MHNNQNLHNNSTRLMASHAMTNWVNQHQKGKPFSVVMNQEMPGWQWHQ